MIPDRNNGGILSYLNTFGSVFVNFQIPLIQPFVHKETIKEETATLAIFKVA